MKIPEAGSKWSGPEGTVFHVISTVKIDRHTWIYYHKEKPRTNDPEEYSCYLESFLQRFRRLPD